MRIYLDASLYNHVLPPFSYNQLFTMPGSKKISKGRRRGSYQRRTAYPKRSMKTDRLKSTVSNTKAEGLSYTIETVTSILDIPVVFNYADPNALTPFGTRLGIASSYPIYSVAGNPVAVFPCVDALQRWT